MTLQCRCLSNILGTPSAPDGAQVIATLALSAGGMGLSSAHRVRSAAHFASWADSLRMVRKRHPIIAESMIRHLEVGGVPCFQAARQCREVVEVAGLVLPSWTELSHSLLPAEAEPHRPPFFKGNAHRLSAFSCAPLPQTAFTSSPVSPHLPMWPPI